MSENKLREKVIRLAHSNPELQPLLLPLVTKTAATSEELMYDEILLMAENEASVYKARNDPRSLEKEVEKVYHKYKSWKLEGMWENWKYGVRKRVLRDLVRNWSEE